MTEPTFEQLCELFGYTPKGRPLQTEDVAEFLGVHKSTVDHTRLRGVGPRFFSPPGTRRVYYAERDVLAWLFSHSRQSTSDQPGETLDLQRTNTPARSVQPIGAARKPSATGARRAAQ